jgi:hypothetical protein
MSCVSIAVADARTGDVYPGPFETLGYGSVLNYVDVPEDKYEELSYNLRSRLLIVRGCPEEKNCGSYFYEWKGTTFRLIRYIPAVRLPGPQ